MIHDKNEDSNKISAADSASTTSSSSSTTTIIATTDITTCRNNNNNNNPCSNNATGSNGCGVAILRANDNDPNYYGDCSSSSNIDGDKNRDIDITNRVVGQIKIKKEEINPCNAIGSNSGVALLRANDNDPNYYGDSSSSSSSNIDGDTNRDLITNRVVGQTKIKKEEIKGMQHDNKNNNSNNNNLDDNSFADWEVGSWCWLLPTTKNHKDDRTNTNDRKRKQNQSTQED